MQSMPPVPLHTLFALSTEGLLVYAPGSEDPGAVPGDRTLVWVDREGNEELIAAPPRPYTNVDLSPDGGHLTVTLSDEQDFWILDLTREPVAQQRLTFDLQSPLMIPLWTPDGQRVVFGSVRDGRWSLSWKAANGTGSLESLHTSENVIRPHTWSPDGKFLIFTELSTLPSFDIWALSLNGELAARPLMAEGYNEDVPAISPDGRWIAYTSDESGQYGVFVRPFPNVDDGKWLVSSQGGVWPVWAPDGRELYYYTPTQGQMMAVTIDTEPTFAVGNPEVLFEGEYFVAFGRPYDISPDGQRFLMMIEGREAGGAAEAAPTTELIVVENWFEELKRLAPVPGKS